MRVRNMGKRLARVRAHMKHRHPHSGAHLGAAMNKKDQAGKDTDKKNGQIVVLAGASKAGTSIEGKRGGHVLHLRPRGEAVRQLSTSVSREFA